MRFRSLFFLLLVLCVSGIKAQQSLDLSKTVRLNSASLTLAELIKALEAQTEFRFSYSPQRISINSALNFTQSTTGVADALRIVQEQLHVQCTVRGKTIVLHAQEKRKATLSGTIHDAETGEALVGAEIVLINKSEGIASNRYGFYSITLPLDETVEVNYFFIGFSPGIKLVKLNQDSVVDIFLEPVSTALDTLSITANRIERASSLNTNTHRFTVSEIKRVPTMAGEPDPIKALQFIPGVITSHEGTISLSVRGGSNDQNLFLLDEATVYNPAHALSFFSVFNTDALQGLTMHKSAIPIKYGGRLSSVVDIQMKEGNQFKQHGSASVGVIASRLTLEGPLSKKNNISYMISGRYGYAGATMNGVYWLGKILGDGSANVSTTHNKIGFYDLNAKMNWRKNDHNHFYLSAYSGHDQFFFTGLTNGYSLNWGNQTTTLRWNHIHGSRLFSNTSAVFSKYNYQYRVLNDSRLFEWHASLGEVNLKQDFDFYVGENNHLTFGWILENRWISPGELVPKEGAPSINQVKLPEQQSLIGALYLGNEMQLGAHWKSGYGIRYALLNQLGPYTQYKFKPNDDYPYDSTITRSGIAQTFHRVDPRAWIAWSPTSIHSLTFSFDRTTQFLHLLSNSAVGMPTDMWMVSGGTIKPQIANIFSFGYTYQSRSKIWQASVSGYHKTMQHISDFKDNANLFANAYVQSQILQGKGLSYGGEFLLQKEAGKFQGNVSYTLAKTTYQIDGINNGDWFPSRNDRRHNIKLNATQKWNKRVETSLNFVFASGAPISMPVGFFRFGAGQSSQPGYYNYYTYRNGYRLPVYHRLDASLRINSRKNEHRKVKTYWSIDVYNVYSRKNPFGVYAQPFGNNTTFRMAYLFGVVPTASYNLTF